MVIPSGDFHEARFVLLAITFARSGDLGGFGIYIIAVIERQTRVRKCNVVFQCELLRI